MDWARLYWKSINDDDLFGCTADSTIDPGALWVLEPAGAGFMVQLTVNDTDTVEMVQAGLIDDPGVRLGPFDGVDGIDGVALGKAKAAAQDYERQHGRPRKLADNGILAPDGHRWPWGPIRWIHAVGNYHIVEYVRDTSDCRDPAMWQSHGERRFTPFINGVNTSHSCDCLDSALVTAITYRRCGPNCQAAMTFDLMTLGSVPDGPGECDGCRTSLVAAGWTPNGRQRRWQCPACGVEQVGH